jgi:hypothetical protein
MYLFSSENLFTLLANETFIFFSVLNNYAIIQVIVPHGEAVTVESFLAWRERFEAELALERAKYIVINNELIAFLFNWG